MPLHESTEARRESSAGKWLPARDPRSARALLDGQRGADADRLDGDAQRLAVVAFEARGRIGAGSKQCAAQREYR